MSDAANPLALVVEDDDMVREAVCAVLQDEGFRVQDFASGEAFLAALPGLDAPRAVLLDVRLGGMDGFEVARQARLLWPDLPVVFISGDMRQLVRQSGPKDLSLMKPFTEHALKQVLQMIAP